MYKVNKSFKVIELFGGLIVVRLFRRLGRMFGKFEYFFFIFRLFIVRGFRVVFVVFCGYSVV